MNHLNVPVDVYNKGSSGNVSAISTVYPEKLFSCPLSTIYTPSGQFMFKPIKEG